MRDKIETCSAAEREHVREPGRGEAPTPRRLRFSLRGLLVGVGVVCSIVSNLVGLRELDRLRNDNRRLRDELGYLNVDDPSQVHVAPARRMEDLQWRWRVYVPKGKWVAACVRGHLSDAKPEAVDRLLLGPGENRLDVAVYASPNGNYRLKMAAENTEEGTASMSSVDMPTEIANRISRPGATMQVPFDTTVPLARDDRRILLQESFPETLLFGGTSDNQRVGLRVWIEEAAAAP